MLDRSPPPWYTPFSTRASGVLSQKKGTTAVELTERKKQILKVVVEHYIASAEPIGSKSVAAELPEKLSSATIRNELSDLSEMGYLEQPHTSAGRIPSPKGYRLYVNELMERHALSVQETEKINEALHVKMAELDDVISRAGQMMSFLVEYPTYMVSGGRDGLHIVRAELLPLDESSFIAVLVLSDDRVRSKRLMSDLAVTAERLADAASVFNAHLTGLVRSELAERLLSLSATTEAGAFLLLSATVAYAVEVLEEAGRRGVVTAGAGQILNLPEYRDAHKAHELMTFLEKREDLPVPTDGAGMQILIGPENVNEALKDSSVVMASYDIGDNMRGLIGVVGPTRMDYATVAARLSYFADGLTRMFGKNELPPKGDTQE